jgi:hypothetical protein
MKCVDSWYNFRFPLQGDTNTINPKHTISLMEGQPRAKPEDIKQSCESCINRNGVGENYQLMIILGGMALCGLYGNILLLRLRIGGQCKKSVLHRVKDSGTDIRPFFDMRARPRDLHPLSSYSIFLSRYFLNSCLFHHDWSQVERPSAGQRAWCKVRIAIYHSQQMSKARRTKPRSSFNARFYEHTKSVDQGRRQAIVS